VKDVNANATREAPPPGLAERTVSDLFLYFPTIAIQGMVGIITASFLSKLFSPGEYGNFILAHGIYLLLGLLGGLWIERSVVRLLPEYKAKGRYLELAYTMIASEGLVVLAMTLISLGLLVGLRHMVSPGLFPLLVTAVTGAAFLSILTPVASVYWVKGRSRVYSTLALTRVLGGLVAGLLLALPMRLGMLGFLIGLNVPIVIILLVFAWLHHHTLRALFAKSRFSRAILRDVLTYGLPYLAMQITAMVLNFSDRYFIRIYSSASDVGIYNIGYTVAWQAMQLVFLVLATVADPVIYRSLEERGPAIAVSYVGRMLRYYTLAGVPCLIALFMLNKELVTLVSTAQYIDAFPVVGYIGLASLIHGYTQIMARIFAFRKKTGTLFAYFLSGCVLNIILNIIFIPLYGFMAAAWSALASYLALFAIMYRGAYRLYPFEFGWSYFLKTFSASAGMAVILYFCRHIAPSAVVRTGVSVIAGLVSYGALILLFRGVSLSEFGLLAKQTKSYFCRAPRGGTA
jgi:O-antigen/teichoic acid export membrane protein